MKIQFDKVSSKYSFPLSSKKAILQIRNVITREIIESIVLIRFGCNTKTTQEARIVKRGKKYDLSVNFFLINFKSPIISEKKEWIKIVEKFGGVIDLTEKKVNWNLSGAQDYTLFLIFHEIGHIMYNQEHFNGAFTGKHGSTAEEKWCDNYAIKTINKLKSIKGDIL